MKRGFGPFLISGLFLAIGFALSIAVGPVYISPGTAIRILGNAIFLNQANPEWPETFSTILLKVRLPHTVLIALTGAALSGSGAAYQGIFRNPLADPYLIGVAAGAGLGAVVGMAINWPQSLLGMYAIGNGYDMYATIKIIGTRNSKTISPYDYKIFKDGYINDLFDNSSK